MRSTTFRIRVFLLFTLILVVLVLLFFVPRFAQPLWYHNFADQRPLLGIPHMCNVVSNLPFVFVGLFGMWVVCVARVGTTDAPFVQRIEKMPYWIFTLFIALTGIGSAYYHSDPNNDRLLWDRMPLAVAFMALFSAMIGERIHRKTGTILTVPLCLIGAGSVVYWHQTELINQGDLRWYLAVQLGPMLALPLILWWFAPQYTRTVDLWAALGWYVLAKVFELADRPIYLHGGMVSGHTLKHLAAGASAYMIVHYLRKRVVY